MRIGTIVFLGGVLIIAIFALPLIYFLYYIAANPYQAIVANMSSTPGPPCGETEYALKLTYSDPVPMGDVQLTATFTEANGSSFVFRASANVLTKGRSLTLCLPSDVLASARAVSFNLTGSIGFVYPISISSWQPVGG